MLDLSTKKKSSTAGKQSIRPGKYTAEVINVSWAPGYIEGDAFVIKYHLINDDGSKRPYEELFFNRDNNSRTCKFFKYLEENNISDLADFVGCTEELTIAKRTDGHKAFNTIAERTFISGAAPEEPAE